LTNKNVLHVIVFLFQLAFDWYCKLVQVGELIYLPNGESFTVWSQL